MASCLRPDMGMQDVCREMLSSPHGLHPPFPLSVLASVHSRIFWNCSCHCDT